MGAKGGGLERLLSDEMAVEPMPTAQEDVDRAGVQASRLQRVNEVLDMETLHLEQGRRAVDIPALDEGF